jgi:hypothetical protein
VTRHRAEPTAAERRDLLSRSERLQRELAGLCAEAHALAVAADQLTAPGDAAAGDTLEEAELRLSAGPDRPTD